VPIVPSRSARTQELLGRLGSSNAAERDSAVAGLTLLGTRVLLPLDAFLPTASPAARLAALEVLERVEDPAAVPAILRLARDPDERVALRALEAAGERPDPRSIGALAALLSAPGPLAPRQSAARALGHLEAKGLVGGLEPLAERLLDEREDPRLRCLILDGLLTRQPPFAARTLRPLLKRLVSSSEPELAARARSTDDEAIEERLAEALASAGLSDAAAARTTAALARRGAVAIPPLVRALDRLGPPGRQADVACLRARGRLHEALAALDTRVALFDLREAIEAHPRAAMPSLLRAASRIGDASVVPALARAAAEDAALVDSCAATLAAIAARERLRRTSAALNSVRPEHRAALALLWDGARSGPRRRR
jgi:HEAT repeat protein